MRRWFLLGVMLAMALSVNAQQMPDSLVLRFRGHMETAAVAPPPPRFQLGMTEQFFVAKNGQPAPVLITARLVGGSSSLLYWVEAGLTLDEDGASESAAQLDPLFSVLRARRSYSQVFYNPFIGGYMTPNDLLSIPDVDALSAVYVIFVRDGVDERAVYVPAHSQPPQHAPAGFSHMRETIVVNMTALNDAPIRDARVQEQIAVALYDIVLHQHQPIQAAWLRAALFEEVVRSATSTPVSTTDLTAYLEQPDVSLIFPSGSPDAAARGLYALFMGYIRQRYGDNLYREIGLRPGDGFAALDSVFAHEQIVTADGAPMTGQRLFGDFLLATVINRRIGDGRYVHADVRLPQNTAVRVERAEMPGQTWADQSVQQFGARYYVYTAPADETITVTFAGAAATPRLVTNGTAPDADAPMFTTGNTQGTHRTLTRRVDLSDAERGAALAFDLWHDLAPYWNYGYITVSTDGGVRWQILPIDGATFDDPYGNAYGAGVTGSSQRWVNATVDLGAYIGQDILLGFETVGVPTHADQGMAISHPVIMYDDGTRTDLSDPYAWTLSGWLPADHTVDQMWFVYGVQTGSANHPARVQAWITPESGQTTGEYRVSLAANETLIVAVSGANDDTRVPAAYTLQLHSDDAALPTL
jgi:hypothetical protein